MPTPLSRVLVDLLPLLPPPLRPWSQQLEPVLDRLFVPARVACGVRDARGTGEGAQFARSLLDRLDIRFTLEDKDWKRIPAGGPVVAVANHPYGIADGLIMAVLLDRVRPDWKILTNSMLAGVTELQEHILPVNPFGTPEASVQNRAPLRQALECLEGGGVLGVFPAGEVAHLDWKEQSVTDPQWHSTAARLALRARCAVVPVFFEGANSLQFQLAGALHPGLRTVGLVHELARLSGKVIRVRIGRPVAAAALTNCRNPAQAAAYLRSRTLLLAHRPEAVDPSPPSFNLTRRRPLAIAPPEPERLLSEEVAALPAESELARQGELSVYVAAAGEIPHMLREIGRRREAAFREIGEGTGKAADLDRFDEYYRHLFLWDRSAHQLAGGYRLVVTSDVVARLGARGLYTNTLFHFKPRFLENLGPAVELGRSFVTPEYQRDFAPLLLLWKGITRLVAKRPEAPVLFGAVSISGEYSTVSRGLIASYLSHHARHPLAAHVAPRRQFRDRALRGACIRELAAAASIEELSLAIADIESDGKGVPVLVRQYLKTGGRLLGLSVDPNFSGTLDALLLADLRQAPPALLERCMGREEARSFLGDMSRISHSDLLNRCARAIQEGH